ncbi:hypothetical protein HHK36_007927 [Tetracentron sinense]|uniref:C3H1-type domain-containing protein n=1 Tax=Tetracentron sinense TaxID=13715 RepID=A0A834ZI45_TETSI|nr:hypothetical protein HHK36_007927 [Tetracentron sinense]
MQKIVLHLGWEKVGIVDTASLEGTMMTEGVRKRKSKWDLKEETLLPYEIRQDDASYGKAGESIKDKESKSGWNSTEVANNHDPKWSDMEANDIMKSKANSGWSCSEPLLGKKGAQKDDNINKDCNEILEHTTAWARDKSHSTSMSPGVDAWRHQNRSRSPKRGWSRSRSRSPPQSFKRESEGWSNKSRNGSGVSARPCKDFSAGRCRRGVQCRFLHHNRNYDDRRHSENGPADIRDSRHERGASRYAKTEESTDYRRDKISHGIGNHYEGNWEKYGTPRNSRSTTGCNDFLKGKCYRGSSCKYVHAASADVHGGSTKELTREREHDRRDKNALFEYEHKREYNMTGSTPCKYFATGNCRNGEYCRFSHAGPAHASPDKSRDDRWGHNLDNENKPWGGSKWDDTSSVFDITKSPEWSDNKFGKVGIPKPMATERSMDENENRKWGGPTWSNKAAEGYGYESTLCRIEDNDVGMGVPNSMGTEKLLDGTDIHYAEASKERHPHHIDKEEPGHMSQGSQSQTLNEISLSNSESAGMGKLLDGTSIHSAGANKEKYPHHIDKEEPGCMPHDSQSQTLNEISLPLHEKNITHEIADQQQRSAVVVQQMVPENSYVQHNPSLRGDAAAVAFPCKDYNAIRNSARSHNEVNFSANVLPMVSVPGQSFNQNGHNFGAQPLSSFNIIGHSQQILPPNTPSGHNFDLNGQVPSNQTLFHQGEFIKRPDMVDLKMSQVTSGTPLTQNVVTSEQVAQITNLSASLSQIFGKGQQLPQLYAALNPPSATGLVPSLPISAGVVSAVAPASIQPNPATWSEKQYDTIGDSVELHKPDINNHPPSSNPIEQKHAAVVDPQIPSKSFSPSSVTGGPTGGNPYKSGGSEEELHHESDKFKQLEPVENIEAKGNNDEVEASKKEQENGHSQNTDPDVQVDEGNKSKDAKEMRTFKFALVEFVKEILKPTWREGQMSKEAHKTIVKKVVDKVTGAIQGAHIPQTQEKIDHYLSYSKPKLTKLVQVRANSNSLPGHI